ncbi:MAG TPA: hypothetical protein VK957_18685 [Lunatimonas sp.]|nr:hypothetical protein [Lunatimonas sp.]
MMTIHNTDTLWFEIALVSFVFALGNILLGHFEEKTPKSRRVTKFISSLCVVCLLSYFFGRNTALVCLAIAFIPVFIIHLWWLPKKGINGWTAEPREKYYKLRGWKDGNITR